MTAPSKLAGCAGAGAMVLVALPYGIQLLRAKPGRSDSASSGQGASAVKEFGGTPGAFSTMLSLPGVIGFLYYACSRDFVMKGLDFASLANVKLPGPEELISTKALGVCAGWLGFQALLERLLPGPVVEGVDLAPAGGSGRLKYRMNGHKAFWVSVLALGSQFFSEVGQSRLSWVYDNFVQLAGASTLIALGLSAKLYWDSFSPGKLLARGGDTGSPVYDFFIGRELNPRIALPSLDFDLKMFCELRPGLIGWVALNMGMAAKQLQATGTISGSMLLVNLMQALYVWDGLYQEQACLTMMDITTDGFGFMLAFGDLAWVPFTYGVQARYLVDHDPGLSTSTLALTAFVGLAGYTIFRRSNSEKDAFRRDPTAPEVRHLKTMEVTNSLTGKPSKLLISGWWGLARKINYTGDWLMSWAWSMTCGCPFLGDGSLLPYFYPIYFAILLIHRAGRDDHFCHQKYGKGWDEYKKKVPYVFAPYLV